MNPTSTSGHGSAPANPSQGALLPNSPRPDPKAALEHLAAALDPHDFVTTLTTGHGRAPRLTVTSRHTLLGEDIYADDEFFWWSRTEPIATIGHPATAASKVTSVLQAAPQTTP